MQAIELGNEMYAFKSEIGVGVGGRELDYTISVSYKDYKQLPKNNLKQIHEGNIGVWIG